MKNIQSLGQVKAAIARFEKKYQGLRLLKVLDSYRMRNFYKTDACEYLLKKISQLG